jgi:hypothetical protein
MVVVAADGNGDGDGDGDDVVLVADLVMTLPRLTMAPWSEAPSGDSNRWTSTESVSRTCGASSSGDVALVASSVAAAYAGRK